ncbi:MAG: MBL fold metallo-hydrolase [Phycisphaerales bacterium]|nr:MBL fold metallo-hydrolase [Phycisphaerales bacterium]MCB9835683.1 MBL fold metallo-hydrolase [Phycisphaera sp.]
MAGSDLIIRSAALGGYQTNCYTVRSGDHLWVVDAGYEPEPLLQLIDGSGLTPEAIVLTHAHSDHIAGIRQVLEKYPGVPIWIAQEEENWLADPELNLSAYLGLGVTAPPASRFLKDGDVLELGETKWRVLHTPGHSPGGLTFVCDEHNVAIVGDALFAGSIGRTDFPGSNHAQLVESIRTKLYALPDETRVLPGHGPETTIGREKRSNPWVPGE